LTTFLRVASVTAYYQKMEKVLTLWLLALTLGCSASGRAHHVDASEAGPIAPLADGGSTFSWSEATPCPVARFEANGVVIDGELWVMGGFLSPKFEVTRRVDIYDPGTDHWRLGPELPGAETHLGVVRVEKDIVLIGGFDGNVITRATTAAVWRWSAVDAAWRAGPDLPAPRAAVAAALLGNEVHAASGLAADGNSDSGEHFVWDLTGPGVWTSAAPLPNPRNHGGGAALGGLLFAVAGRHGWDEVSGDDPALDAFDPVTGSWTARTGIPRARSEIGASTVSMPDGRLLVVGGSVAGMRPSGDVLVYDPLSDLWSSLPSLPGPRKGAVAARVGSNVVVTTGSPTSTDPSATTYIGCCL